MALSPSAGTELTVKPRGHRGRRACWLDWSGAVIRMPPVGLLRGEELWVQCQVPPVTELDRCRTSVKSLGEGLEEPTLGPGRALLSAAQGDTVDYPGAPDERGCPRCRHGGAPRPRLPCQGLCREPGRAPAAGHSGRVLEDPSVSRIIGSLLPGAALRVKGVLTTQHLAPCGKL